VRPATRVPTHDPITQEHSSCVLGTPFPHVLSTIFRIGVDAGEFALGDTRRNKIPRRSRGLREMWLYPALNASAFIPRTPRRSRRFACDYLSFLALRLDACTTAPTSTPSCDWAICSYDEIENR
jgi:hypothetical protein